MAWVLHIVAETIGPDEDAVTQLSVTVLLATKPALRVAHVCPDNQATRQIDGNHISFFRIPTVIDEGFGVWPVSAPVADENQP